MQESVQKGLLDLNTLHSYIKLQKKSLNKNRIAKIPSPSQTSHSSPPHTLGVTHAVTCPPRIKGSDTENLHLLKLHRDCTFHLHLIFFSSEIESCYVAQAGLELRAILLPQPQPVWNTFLAVCRSLQASPEWVCGPLAVLLTAASEVFGGIVAVSQRLVD